MLPWASELSVVGCRCWLLHNKPPARLHHGLAAARHAQMRHTLGECMPHSRNVAWLTELLAAGGDRTLGPRHSVLSQPTSEGRQLARWGGVNRLDKHSTSTPTQGFWMMPCLW